MNSNNFIERQNQKLDKFRLLPHPFKIIGWVMAVLALIALVAIENVGGFPAYWLPIFKGLLLVSLLTVTISKDKVEDEYIYKLRLVAFGIAFVSGVLYSVFQPLVDYTIHYIDYARWENYQEFNSFQVLGMMLAVQIGAFIALKQID